MRHGNRRSMGIVGFMCLLAAGFAVGSDEIPARLVGTWDYMSMTVTSGARVHFKPGQWTLKLNQDATWVMQGPLPNAKPVSGTYEVHGSTLKMKGGNDLEYHFSVKHGGKVLELKDKGTEISATRE